ncbi:TetR/AcrR family transcriptional regulator [Mariniblastus sp.]|nr:TetR/AcrR family transcriptional regulator [Mariniblastus sp.]
MIQLSPKQQEIKLREQRILEAARSTLIQHGYHGLSMEQVAATVNYSKGTVYNHFANKEEIIVALAIEIVAKRLELFKKAAQFKGASRFRMLAVGQAAGKFVQTFPDFFMLEQILQLPSVRQKISEKRQHEINSIEVLCMDVVAGIVRDAVSAEDLILAPDQTPEKLVFGLWSLSSGGFAIASRSGSLPHLGLENPFELVDDHTAALMDGFGWAPKSLEYDAKELKQRIHREVLSDE